jgi:hypothetical protein
VYTFDSTTVDTDLRVDTGTYPTVSVEFTIGQNTYTSNPSNQNNIFVSDNFNADTDRYSLVVNNPFGPNIGGLPIENINFSFQDPTGTVFSSTSLPLIQPDPKDFNSTVALTLFFKDPLDSGRNGAITAYNNASISAVPIPAAIWFFAPGLLGLIGLAKRNKEGNL